MAELLTEVLGRPVRYEAVGAIKYFRHLRGQGLVLAQAVVQTILHAGLKRGDAEAVTDELPMLLGRPSRTIRDYVEDNRDLWTATADASAT